MKELLIEANYTEFRKRYENGKPFALISAFQGNLDVSQNKKNNIELRKKIQEQGYSVIRVIGKYQEDDSYYESMLVFCEDKEKYKDFLRFLLFFGKHYYQNSFIVVDTENNIWEYATKQNSSVGAIGSKKRYDRYLNKSNTELDDLIARFTRRTYELDNIRVVND